MLGNVCSKAWVLIPLLYTQISLGLMQVPLLRGVQRRTFLGSKAWGHIENVSEISSSTSLGRSRGGFYTGSASKFFICDCFCPENFQYPSEELSLKLPVFFFFFLISLTPSKLAQSLACKWLQAVGELGTQTIVTRRKKRVIRTVASDWHCI